MHWRIGDTPEPVNVDSALKVLDSQETLVTAHLVHTGLRSSLTSGASASANAVLIRNGLIAAVGDAAALRGLAPRARVIDLPGATLTPGLIDAHVHLTEWALTRSQVDLAHASSPAHAARILRNDAGVTGADWVRGRGWSAHTWGSDMPHRAVLDDVFPSTPVALQSHDMHSLWLNSTALAAAAIDDTTPDPVGGRIVRDADGAPTGLLLETAAQLVLRHIAPPTLASTIAAVTDAQRALHAFGITGVHSLPGIHIPEPDPFAVLQQMIACDVLRLRVLHHIAREKLDSAIDVGLRSGFGNDWLRVGGVKLFLDGALGSRTAWMREPYEGTDSRGVNVLARDEFAAIVAAAANAGIATTVHAIGDAAVSLALDELTPEVRRVENLPHRIEHVQCCPPERLADFARGRIVASVQPCHLMSDWRAADRYWGERGRNTYAFASLSRQGAVLAFGSDAPVEPVDPRLSLFAAVARKDTALEPAAGWYAEERITAAQALEAFTAGPALAAGTRDVQGVLREGAWADIAAWSADPLMVNEQDLLTTRCVATFVAGEPVYS
jgi:predicted amidohydrolase YtcJ